MAAGYVMDKAGGPGSLPRGHRRREQRVLAALGSWPCSSSSILILAAFSLFDIHTPASELRIAWVPTAHGFCFLGATLVRPGSVLLC